MQNINRENSVYAVDTLYFLHVFFSVNLQILTKQAFETLFKKYYGNIEKVDLTQLDKKVQSESS